MMNDSTTKIIKEVLLGMLAYVIIASVPVLIFTHDKIKGEGGLIAGALVGALMLISINVTLNHAIHMTKSNGAYLGFMSAGRLLAVALFLFAVGWFGWLNLITTFIGLMGLKVATYLQPITEKLIAKAKTKK